MMISDELLPTPRVSEGRAYLDEDGNKKKSGIKALIENMPLTSSPEDSLVNHSPRPESGKAQMMTVISGLKCSELSKSSSRLGLLVRMLLESSVWRSTKAMLKWQAKPIYSEIKQLVEVEQDEESCTELLKNLERSATKYKYLLFQLLPSTLPTDEIGSGLLQTPNAEEAVGRGEYKDIEKLKERCKKHQPHLSQTIAMLPTPKKQNSNSPGKHGQGGMDLQTKIQETSDIVITAKNGIPNHLGNGKKMENAQTVDFLPTPNSHDGHIGYQDRSKKSAQENVETKVRNATGGKETGLKLQPSFVEWMMGYSSNWTDLSSPKPDTG